VAAAASGALFLLLQLVFDQPLLYFELIDRQRSGLLAICLFLGSGDGAAGQQPDRRRKISRRNQRAMIEET
jgi:hypothetical protein